MDTKSKQLAAFQDMGEYASTEYKALEEDKDRLNKKSLNFIKVNG